MENIFEDVFIDVVFMEDVFVEGVLIEKGENNDISCIFD